MAKFFPARIIEPFRNLKIQIKLRLSLFVLFCLVLYSNLAQAQIQDLTINSTYTIAAGTTLTVNNLTVNSTLIVNGTLVVYGNLITGNSSIIEANAGSSVFIFQDANLANQVTINLSSYFIVLGNFNKGGASNQGSLSVSDAHIYIFGELNLPEKGWEDFSICSPGGYDGTTKSLTDDLCDAGNYDDFINNIVPEDLPEDLYQLILDKVNGCVSPEITNPGNQVSCGDYTLPNIGGSNLVNPGYYDNSQMLGGNKISGPISTTQTVWIYDEGADGCSDEEQFQVVIHPVPAAIISGDAIICDDGSAANLRIDFTGTPPWNFTLLRDGSNEFAVENISANPYVLTVYEPGVYSIIAIADTHCSGTVSGTATIQLKPLPLTGDIEPD